MRVKDAVVGAKVGRLTILELFRKKVRARKGEEPTMNWLHAKARCDCGNEVVVRIADLGQCTNSCGCIHDECVKRHGMSYSPFYRTAAHIKHRCEGCSDPRHARYYRDRGITFGFDSTLECALYLAALENAGLPGYSVDRIDNDRGYEPGNLRWATATQQARNRRCTRGTYKERFRDECHFTADKELCPTAQI